jgi:tetratricopeptide (TPR) repeat protein
VNSDVDEREAAFTRALELQRERRFEEAAALLRPRPGGPVSVKAAMNLGICLAELGRYGEAEHWLSLAARHRPDAADLRHHLAGVYAETGRPEQAELEYLTALAFAPQYDASRLALAGLYLSLGRYAEGWPLLETRAKLHPDMVPPIQLTFPPWSGEPLHGKSILIWWEQGLGDQIQMCRFANLLKARGAAHVALGCRPALAHLFSTLEGADEIIPVSMGETLTIRRYDYWTRYFSVPGPLGITLANLPASPYLSAPADRREAWRGWSGVGLVWKASPTGFNARNKGLPDAVAQRLLDVGARSLHPEDTGARDFADTAAILEQLDLVISIDTSVAHLAGAMGRPCWTLLPRVHTDWRWLVGRTDSPWYPSMRLYRQREPGRWDDVVDQVLADLPAR